MSDEAMRQDGEWQWQHAMCVVMLCWWE